MTGILTMTVVSAPSTLVAGATSTITVEVTNTDPVEHAPGTVTLAAGAGAGAVIVGADASVLGLRGASPAFGRAASAAALTCSPSGCELPVIAAGGRLSITLQLVASTSTSSALLDLMAYDQQLTVGTVNVTSGYTEILIKADSAPVAGTSIDVQLTALIADGATDPGPISIPQQLSAGIVLNGSPEVCDAGEAALSCSPLGGSLTVTLPALVLAHAVGPQTITIVDAAGRSIPVTLNNGEGINVQPLPTGGPINLVGFYGGVSIGAPTLVCAKPGAPRDTCDRAIQHPTVALDMPTGATVVSATLTWAQSTSVWSVPPSVALTVDGVTRSVVGSKSSLDGVVSFTADVTKLISGPGKVSVTEEGFTVPWLDPLGGAFRGWTLTVIWSDPATPLTWVSFRSDLQRASGPGASGTAALGTLARPAVRYVTLWSADAGSAATFAPKDLSQPVVTGVDANGRAAGYQLLTTLTPGLGGDMQLSSSDRDGLWAGPVLVVSVLPSN